MLKVVSGNIFDTRRQALICPVNTKGVMGAGLAKQFAEHFPECLGVYKMTIELAGGIRHGGDIYFDDQTIWDPRTNEKYIVYFATKEDYRNPSRLEWIERGLLQFVQHAKAYWIKSAAFPMLGCGLGGLNRTDVMTLFKKYFDNSQYDVEIYLTGH